MSRRIWILLFCIILLGYSLPIPQNQTGIRLKEVERILDGQGYSQSQILQIHQILNQFSDQVTWKEFTGALLNQNLLTNRVLISELWTRFHRKQKPRYSI
jgi:hypothetical protein